MPFHDNGILFLTTSLVIQIFDLEHQPCTQASSRYLSDRRRLGTERDSATSLTGDVTSEIAEDDWERGCWNTILVASDAQFLL